MESEKKYFDKNGKFDAVGYIFKRNRNPTKNIENLSFGYHCVSGNVESVKKHIKKYSVLPNSKTMSFGFFDACLVGNLSVVKYLRETYNIPITKGYMVSSCEKGHFETVKYLISELKKVDLDDDIDLELYINWTENGIMGDANKEEAEKLLKYLKNLRLSKL